MANASSKTVVYAALAGNLLIAVTKFGAAFWTGSSAMLSEGVHSLVDTGNELLLLYGMHRAARPADLAHPLGHGRELYFWSFLVALLLFALGAGVSLYEGILHVLEPTELVQPVVNYVVLGFSFLFEGASWMVAWREFRSKVGPAGFWSAVTSSKDPTTFIVLFEDSAALLGIVIAAAGTALTDVLGDPVYDGVASIGIGLLLATVATFLARECKGLLIGEPARRDLQESIARIAGAQLGTGHVGPMMTFQIGPEQVVVALTLDAVDAAAGDVVQTTARLEEAIKQAHPDVVELFFRAGS